MLDVLLDLSTLAVAGLIGAAAWRWGYVSGRDDARDRARRLGGAR